MGLYKVLRIVALILAVFGIAFALMVAGGSEGMIDNMMYVAYVILAIVIVLVLFYVIKGVFAGNIKKTLLSLGIFFGIVIVSYLMSSGTDLNLQPFIDKGQNITEATSKMVGAGLYTFYALGILAIASMLFSGLKKIGK
jgi:hypothetical protein